MIALIASAQKFFNVKTIDTFKRFLPSSFFRTRPQIGADVWDSFPPFRLGTYYAKGIPVLIPNTEVKLRRAHGTAVLTVGE